MLRRTSFTLAALLSSACATLPPLFSAREAPPLEPSESFYGAQAPKALRSFAEQLQRTNGSAALTHEVLSQLAQLDGREDLAFEELMAALADLNDDAALLHVHLLGSQAWTEEHRKPALALMRALAVKHPDADVRAAASHYAAHQLGLLGELDTRDQWVAGLPGRVPLTLVGTWDNEQGKGFEEELAPETRPQLGERYAGRAHPLLWRKDAPTDPRGRYDLAALLQPNRWVVAYAQGTFEAPKAGRWSLRITTTDPIKVWVDGKPVFTAVHMDESLFDNVVVPVDVAAGKHTVLVKSAQREGSWLLSVRALEAQADEFPALYDSLKGLLEWRVRKVKGEERKAALLAAWARASVGGLWAVQAADAWVHSNPKGLLARLQLIDALWFNQERGRTADLLTALDAEVGDEVTFVRLRAIRFQQQQGIKQKARERLLKLIAVDPQVREAQSMLADLYQQEGWLEDELQLEHENLLAFSPTSTERFEHARTTLRDGRVTDARLMLEQLVSELPGHLDSLRKLSDLALDAGDLQEAEKRTLWRLRVWPTDLTGWSTLAEIYRRMGSRAAADDALRHAQYLCPDWAAAYASRAALAYEAGEKESAIGLWRSALTLNPEDERLANRLDYLSPESRPPWSDDVPADDLLAAAVASRASVKPLPGADVAYLLDHEVTQLASDGSTQNVVTLVMHAFNAAGRDRLTRQAVSGARLRMLHAYSVDPGGQRTEASSERAGSVFFRNLQVGSTVVLQYRNDEPAKGYLSHHLTKSWAFQGLSDQRVRAEFVLWAPLSTKLHETAVGPVKREESKRGDQLRIDWFLLEASPLVYEPAMPTVAELGANIRISTVPDWDTWLSWEKALLVGAFRSSPEVDAVAERLSKGASAPLEKARRVHQFVMEEIRYQQDYESFIAGVKPHAAPMVLERKYGDCKDKAVLFITLAKKLGLDAHFALVRTRDAGPIDADVPMQQFNHAIVYVPRQEGLAEGRFFDPTADALDLDAVRSDDTGTKSLVFDPTTGAQTWREIPFQGAELNSERWKLDLKLDRDGAGTGALVVSANGRTGSLLRRTARNLEQSAQLMQRQAQRLVPGASASELSLDAVKDLAVPAQLSARVATKTLARVEGPELRLKLPSDFAVRGLFALAQRRHPLVLGAPNESVTQVTLELPEGFVVTRAPADAEVKAPCMSFSRKVQVSGAKVTAELKGRFSCERIGPSEYAAYRGQAEDMSKLLDEELVVSLSKPGKPAPKQARSP
ncbi:MAG: hypothetical protein IPJ65_02035 [Archangiaceae bacterium]|nr:hypothetical protein [Archangiaceae bacterium]